MAAGIADWPAFLREWDREAIALLREYPPATWDRVAAAAIERGSILREPATEEEIALAQARLGRSLSPSVQNFYRASNGLSVPWFDAEHAEIWPLAEVKPAVEADPEFVRMYSLERRWAPDADYFEYGPEQRTFALRSAYFETLIQLSARVDAATLQLNPQVVTPAGEWEAWFWGDELPGARRYRSFEELPAGVRHRTLASGRRSASHI